MQQFAFCLCSAELLCCARDFPQLLQLLGLLVNEQLGITDDVDEENVPDFELHIGFGRHAISLPRSSESDEGPEFRSQGEKCWNQLKDKKHRSRTTDN